MLHDDAAWPGNMMNDPRDRINNLRQQLKQDHLVGFFFGENDIEARFAEALSNERFESWKSEQAKPFTNDYAKEVYLEFSLACHEWKNAYINLYPGGFMDEEGGTFEDVWDKMIKTARHEYSAAQWNKYRPLFDPGIRAFGR